jgi:opacity protein-like surface antigen
MFRRFGRSQRPGFAAILSLALACSSALADDPCECRPAGRGIYMGVFGGGGGSSINSVSQIGTALFPESDGGPLDVHATGSSRDRAVGLVGLQIGHEWSGGWGQSGWELLPAAELEGFYFTGTQRALLDNSNARLPQHFFDDSFPMDNAVFMTNLVLSLGTPCSGLNPYVGGGIGAACVSINGADSPQVVPPEPGINHFNSGTDSSSWGFAAQAKVGVRLRLTDHAFLFTEYRFLYVGSTNYLFGSTQYPTHAPTTPWTVRFGDMCNHLGVGGIGFNF